MCSELDDHARETRDRNCTKKLSSDLTLLIKVLGPISFGCILVYLTWAVITLLGLGRIWYVFDAVIFFLSDHTS